MRNRTEGLPFRDRIDAGRRLAGCVTLRTAGDAVVVGLPRGGVPVAAEVARAHGVPLDVIIVRKVGLPWQPELAMGAIGEAGVRVVNDEVVHAAGIDDRTFAEVEARERIELERRAEQYRQGHDRIPLAGRDVVIVDDGIATGSTARAACLVARAEGAAHITLATPVAPVTWTDELADVADVLTAVATPRDFRAIGRFYADFSPTPDAEVIDCLRDARRRS